MNKKVLAIALAVVVLLAAVVAVSTVTGSQEPSDLWVLCVSSAAGAANNFREYARSGTETAWWSAVSEYHSFMQSYRLLKDGGNAEYTWCHSVYGFLLKGPAQAGDQMEDLIQAMEMLAENPDDPNTFEIINRVKHALMNGE